MPKGVKKKGTFTVNLGARIDISKLSYQADSKSILNEISFCVEAGESLALLGPSGSGKTTLLKCIAGLLAPSGGFVDVLSNASIGGQTKMGFVFQDLGIFDRSTVAQNISLGDKSIISSETAKLVFRTLKIDGLLDRDVRNLSGGERQRIAIARALVRAPAVMLMDEPFANLDGVLASELEFLMMELQDKLGFTLVFVSHDMSTAARVGDELVYLEQGNLVQKATYSKFITEPSSLSVLKFFSKFPPVYITSASWDISHLNEPCTGWLRSENLLIEPIDTAKYSGMAYRPVKVIKTLNSWPTNYILVSSLDDEDERFVVRDCGAMNPPNGVDVLVSADANYLIDFDQ